MELANNKAKHLRLEERTMKKTQYKQWLSAVAALALISNCSESEFKAGNKKKGIVQPADTKGDDAPAPLQETFEIGHEEKAPVDIVMAMDTSRSMIEEKSDLEENMKIFFTQLEEQNIDAHIIAMGSAPSTNDSGFEFPSDLPSDKFQVVERKVSSYDAISVLTSFYRSGETPLPFRDNANHEVVIISDDNGTGPGNSPEDFDPNLPARKVTVNSIIGLEFGPDKENSNCNIAAVGTVYQQLSRETDGLILDLCEKDWTQLVKDLAESIVKRTEKKFKISKPVDSSKSLKVTLNGSELSVDKDYTISAEGELSILVETQAGDQVVVEYYAAE
jgi:hypothetical protein